MVFCSYTLAGLLELADISLPEDFGDEERDQGVSTRSRLASSKRVDVKIPRGKSAKARASEAEAANPAN